MLELPGESCEWSCGRLFKYIYFRVNGHISFVRGMIRATLAIRYSAVRPARGRIENIDDYAWRIGGTAFVYVPEVDDVALTECAELQLAAKSVIFLAPPDRALVLKYALRVALRRWKPQVKSISEFVEKQLNRPLQQCQQSRDKRTRLWLGKYNAAVRREFEANALVVKLPAKKQRLASAS